MSEQSLVNSANIWLVYAVNQMLRGNSIVVEANAAKFWATKNAPPAEASGANFSTN